MCDIDPDHVADCYFFCDKKKIKIVIGLAVFVVMLLFRIAELGTTLYYINRIAEYSNDTWKAIQEKLSIDGEIKNGISIFRYYEKNDTDENGEN